MNAPLIFHQIISKHCVPPEIGCSTMKDLPPPKQWVHPGVLTMEQRNERYERAKAALKLQRKEDRLVILSLINSWSAEWLTREKADKEKIAKKAQLGKKRKSLTEEDTAPASKHFAKKGSGGLSCCDSSKCDENLGIEKSVPVFEAATPTRGFSNRWSINWWRYLASLGNSRERLYSTAHRDSTTWDWSYCSYLFSYSDSFLAAMIFIHQPKLTQFSFSLLASSSI